MRESVIETAVCKFARDHGCLVVKLSGPNDRGIPDRMFLKDGKAVFVEFKAPKKKPTALQFKRLRVLKEAGFAATWFDNVEGAKAWLIKTFDL